MVICFALMLFRNAGNNTLMAGTLEMFQIIIFSAQSGPVPNTQWELNKHKLMMMMMMMMMMINSLRHTPFEKSVIKSTCILTLNLSF